MKLLVIGIDGGTKRIFDYMPMPFAHKLFAGGSAIILQEDLLSRGWAEILTGRHASDTGAFYLKPITDKTYRFDRSYGMRDMISVEGVVPIWSRLNSKNVSIGISNVPTTGPAPEVNGFVIAGGGGGLKAGKSISPKLVYPREDVAILERNDYVFDIRLPRSTISFTQFADSIVDAQEVQKNSFIAMCQKHQPEFGFHCFRITTELQYLAMSEIESYIEKSINYRAQGETSVPLSATQEKIVEHYKHMDKCIEEIFSACQPDHYLFVADHSTKPLRVEVDVDVMLENLGFLKRMDTMEELKYRTTMFAKRSMNRIRKRYRPQTAWRPHRFPITRFSRTSSQAFGTFYETGNFGGIYINDRERFGGPVRTESEVSSLVSEICSAINSTNEAAEWSLHARPYRERFGAARYQHLMPDIQIQKPDELYFTCRKGQFAVPNQNFGPVPEDLSGIRYPFTGAKGSDPIFVHSNSMQHLLEEGDPNDLRLAYRLIDRAF